MRLGETEIAPGALGSAVKDLQAILLGQGYNVGPIDGNFGAQTVAAVKSFQAAKGLLPDGVVGVKTWDALKSRTPIAQPPGPEPRTTPATSPMMTMFTSSAAVITVGLFALYIVLGKKL